MKTSNMTSDKLLALIKRHGVDRIKFQVKMRPIRTALGFFGYTTSRDPEVKVICGINEDRYKLEQRYKITLKAEDEGFGKDHYYISDLASLIRAGQVKIFVEL